jgi:PBSX family phage terminase large subunit
MLLDLTLCFPLSENTGTRGPLPKQAAFMDQVLDPKKSKYIAYVGGVGSGKTMIGCITMIIMAVQYPGDYLICRQFLPELKITTLKTFLEICPPELIKEYRVADGIVKLKAVNGQDSTIIFRQLEDPDKLRSLNLSGFYIDEASQVSEAAFMLLQGRLRGKGLRKGFLTSNPNGHDWIYSWFVKQDHFNKEEAKKQYALVKAPSTENIHLPEGYVESMLASWSEDRIRREIEGSFDAFEGQIYSEFRRDVHVVPPFAIPSDWIRVMGMDHGYRNHAAAVWGAVDYDENIYIYKEFYEREWLIEEICKGHKKTNKPGIIEMCKGEKITQARIDPSVRATRGATGFSDWDVYQENLPRDFPLMLANNDVATGIDRVKSYMKINPNTNKPRVFVFSSCTNLLNEIAQYRYKETMHTQVGKIAEKEAPVKVNDHLMDAFRYLIMSRPQPPEASQEIWKKVKYNSLEGALIRDLASVRNPVSHKDPFGD